MKGLFGGRSPGASGVSWDRIPASPLAWAVALWTAAAAIRAWILFEPDVVYAWDMSLFVSWARGLNELGLRGFYDSGVFCDYPPVLVLLVRGVGWILGLIVENPSDYAFQVSLKLLAVAGDFAIGLLLWREGTRLLGASKGLLVCGLYLLNPVSIYDSAVWGQFDSIYTMFLVAAVMWVGRRRWLWVGVLAALALTTKFQSVAVLPLVALESYRVACFRGLGKFAVGFVLALGVVSTPFLATGTLPDVWSRAYVDVIGQYQSLSNNAFNVWSFAEDPTRSDTTPPISIVRAVAGDRDSIAVDESPLLDLTLRRLSMIAFALAVAVVLSLYSLRPGVVARWGAAGLLVLSFYLFPTEMHERYAYPALALLAVWAASSQGRERVYWALTIAVTLNLVAVLPVDALAPQIAAVSIIVFVLLLWGLAAGLEPPEADPSAAARLPGLDPEPRPSSEPALLQVFRRVSGAVLVTVLLVVGGVYVQGWILARPASASNQTWLTDLKPMAVEQGWGTLGFDRSVSAGPLCIGDRYYTRGLGTHAPAAMTFPVPEGSTRFTARVGIHRFAGDSGSAGIQFVLDGKTVFQSGMMTPKTDPVPVSFEVVGGRVLRIEVDDGGNGSRADHVDIVAAVFQHAVSK